MFRLLSVAVFAALVGCASQHTIVSSSPRTVEINGSAWNAADNQKAYDLAESHCAKQGRHASLKNDGGSKPNAWWVFDCVL